MCMVSIIVPIYKTEKYLTKCVESIINQTNNNLEIILVDDGSPDNCPQLCDDYAKKDSRIRVIHKENGGLSDARNAGLDIATGEYLMFVDSDDYIADNMVAELLELIKKDSSDMVICDHRVVDENGNDIIERCTNIQLKNELLQSEEIFLKLNAGNGTYVTACGKLYVSAVFENIRFPKGKLHEDEFVIHHTMGKCKKVSCTDKRLYCYVQRDGSIMNSSYTVRNLDYAEALVDRLAFLSGMDMCGAALRTVDNIIFVLVHAPKRLNLKNKENKKRYKELLNMFKAACRDNTIIKKSLRYHVKISLFNLSPSIYGAALNLHIFIVNLFKGK